MSQSPKEFGRLLTEIIGHISTFKHKPKDAVQDYMGFAAGYDGGKAMIERWRRGKNIPKKIQTAKAQEKIDGLVRHLWQETEAYRTQFDRRWFRYFLVCWGHPPSLRTQLLDELFPKEKDAVDDDTLEENVEDIQDTTEPSPVDDKPKLDDAYQGVIPPLPESEPALMVRKRDLSINGTQLKQHNFIYLAGMPGMGKTTLGVTLAKNAVDSEEQIFYYKLQGQDDLPLIVHGLADFLAYHGDNHFYDLLQQNETNKLYTILLKQLLTTLRGRQFLLCLDDFHQIDETLTDLVMNMLIESAQRGEISVIILSRQVHPGVENMKIEGLKNGEFKEYVTQLLGEDADKTLSEDALKMLKGLTKGNPLFVKWIITIIQNDGLDNLFDRIIKDIELGDFMLNEIDQNLNKDEQKAIQALAICLESPASRQLLEAIANGKNLVRPLKALRDQHLVEFNKRDETYTLHALVQQFYYELLDRQECLIMHKRAADYYCQEMNPFKAAEHYQLAEKYIEAAAQLIGENRDMIINQGYAVAAARRLEAMQEHLPQDSAYQGQLLEALGLFYRIQGAFETALATFERGSQQTADPQREVTFLSEILRVYRSQGLFEKALEIAQKIMDLYEQHSELPQEARVLNGIGWVYSRLGQMEKAAFYFRKAWGEDGSTLEPDIAPYTQLGLGAVALRMGNHRQAEDHFLACRRRFRRLKNLMGEAQSLNNLGVLYQEQQRNEEALDCLGDMLEIVESVGDIHETILGHHNIAITYIQQEKFSMADTYLREGIALAEQIKNKQLLCRLQANLARVYLIANNIETAKSCLSSAEKCRQEAGYEAEQGILYYVSSEIALAQDNATEALTLAKQAIPLLERTYEEDYLPLARLVCQRAQEMLGQMPDGK